MSGWYGFNAILVSPQFLSMTNAISGNPETWHEFSTCFNKFNIQFETPSDESGDQDDEDLDDLDVFEWEKASVSSTSLLSNSSSSPFAFLLDPTYPPRVINHPTLFRRLEALRKERFMMSLQSLINGPLPSRLQVKDAMSAVRQLLTSGSIQTRRLGDSDNIELNREQNAALLDDVSYKFCSVRLIPKHFSLIEESKSVQDSISISVLFVFLLVSFWVALPSMRFYGLFI